MTQTTRNNYFIPFALVTSLFFLWAFVHNLEPILIPHLKKACRLTDLESALIDSAVYIGYFVMALPAGLVMKRFGYKAGILVGLLMYGAGALLFLPAADTRQYGMFLGALFVIASGCAFLETAANPYVTMLGPREGAHTRINFAQSFNGFGAFIAPFAGGLFILSGKEYSEEALAAMSPSDLETYLQMEADAVKFPYLIIALVVLFVAALVWFTKMPDGRTATEGKSSGNLRQVLKHRQLKWGVVAQFFYVGAQVGVTSFFIRFSKYSSGVLEKEAAFWLSMALLGFMIGRFAGTFLSRFIPANRLLFIYATCCIVLLTLASLVKSELALWALIVVPFFESIIFPTIFSLSIDNLKEDTELGSSLVVMAIAGGAFFPLAMGWISDATGNIQIAYLVPVACLLVVLWYSLDGYRANNISSSEKSSH